MCDSKPIIQSIDSSAGFQFSTLLGILPGGRASTEPLFSHLIAFRGYSQYAMHPTGCKKSKVVLMSEEPNSSAKIPKCFPRAACQGQYQSHCGAGLFVHTALRRLSMTPSCSSLASGCVYPGHGAIVAAKNKSKKTESAPGVS